MQLSRSCYYIFKALLVLFLSALQESLLYVYFAEINRCEPNPCFHGGTCEQINGGVGYVCQCQPGYKGEMCERKLSST